MAHGYDTMMNPAIEDLLERTESKFVLVSLASKRSREITNYLGQLGGGVGAIVPPQLVSMSAKPLSIALEEISAGKIEAREMDEDEDGDEWAGAGNPLADASAENEDSAAQSSESSPAS